MAHGGSKGRDGLPSAEESISNNIRTKFDNDVTEIIRRETISFRLKETGKIRQGLKQVADLCVHQASLQLPVDFQVALLKYYVETFMDASEYSLACEYLKLIQTKCDEIEGDDVKAAKLYVEAVQNTILCYKDDILSAKLHSIAPMAVSKLLLCLRSLRESLEKIFSLNTRQQESLSWLIMNICKVILDIAQPLVWLNCGKYVVESILFAELGCEAVLNLCTPRHIVFRMKLFTTAFYALLVDKSSMGDAPEAMSVVHYASKQVAELKERESLDPPIPVKTALIIYQCELDIAIMRTCSAFWKDPDSLNLADASLAAFKFPVLTPEVASLMVDKSSNQERVVAEILRVHRIASSVQTEMRKKRASSILRAYWKYSEENQQVCSNWSSDTNVEILIGAIFEQTENAPATDVLNFIFKCLESAANQDRFENARDPNTWAIKELSMLKNCNDLIRSNDVVQTAEISRSLVDQIDELIYSDAFARRQAFLRRLAVLIWSKFIYPNLQQVLSSTFDDATSAKLQGILPALQASSKILGVAMLEDPLLLASIALVYAMVLRHFKEYRTAISWLKATIDIVEDQRANRVEVKLHFPDEIADVSAMQRISFTTKAEASDWFMSVKRLGAHAFAGYGIFGMGSESDRTDQALAEMHTDLTSLYFRSELEYCLLERVVNIDFQQTFEKEATVAAKQLLTKTLGVAGLKKKKQQEKEEHGKSGGKKGKTTRNSTAGGGSRAGTTAATVRAAPVAPSFVADVDKLSCVPQLKALCCKNNYSKSLLYIELARLESQATKRLELLQEARDCIEDAETRERVLLDSFSNYTILREADSIEKKSYPLVLARTHKSVYLAPVGPKKSKRAVIGYQILAKELGSGTGISLVNNDMAGCEKQILIKDMGSISSSAVRISNLRPGESYVFGSVAIDDECKQIPSLLSMSTPPIDAVNPLPTIALWGFLCQICKDFEIVHLGKYSALKILQRFFQAVPDVDVVSVGRGFNLFACKEPVLTMMAIKQSSNYILTHFLEAFLLFEDPNFVEKSPFEVSEEEEKINWNIRNDVQLKKLYSLRKTACAATVATAIKHHELIVRVLVLGYNMMTELAEYDEFGMAATLQPIAISFISCLQSVPKRHWHELEHQLYSRLMYHVVRMSISSRNTKPVAYLLDEFILEFQNNEAVNNVSNDVLFQYLSLAFTSDMSTGFVQTQAFTNQLKSLFKLASPESVASPRPSPRPEADSSTPAALSAIPGIPPTTGQFKVGYLWRVSAPTRIYSVRGLSSSIGCGNSAANPDAAQLEKWFAEYPLLHSDLLRVVSVMLRELIKQDQPQLCWKLIQKFAVYDKHLSPLVLDRVRTWKLLFVKILPPDGLPDPSLLSAPPPDPKAKAPAAKGGKGAKEPEPVAVAADDAGPKRIIPERFETTADEEVNAQLFYLADICYSIALSCHSKSSLVARDFYPKSDVGPLQVIDPYAPPISSSVTSTSPRGDGASVEEVKVSPRTSQPSSPRLEFNGEFTKIDFMRHLLASVTFFSGTNKPLAVNMSLVKLWNYVVNQWVAPEHLYSECLPLEANLLEAMRSIMDITEKLTGMVSVEAALTEDDGDDGSAKPIMDLKWTDEYSIRTIKEMLLTSREFVCYFLKVLWLQETSRKTNLFEHVIDLGSRILAVYTAYSPEFSKVIGDSIFPMLIQAQEQIICRCEDLLKLREGEKAAYVSDFEEMMKKKRRKKARVAKLEKDEDEIRFEIENARLEDIVRTCDTALNTAKDRMDDLRQQRKRFDMVFSTGVQLLDKVRILSTEFLNRCKQIVTDREKESGSGETPALTSEDAIQSRQLRSCLTTKEMTDEFDDINSQFKQLANFLREKNDRVTLLEALKEHGDFQLLFEGFENAKRVWHDAIDGFFNVMDAHLYWENVCLDVGAKLTASTLEAIPPVIVILGKLSRYSATSNWISKCEYSRFAATLCRFLYTESCNHPKTITGFAAYVCAEVGGVSPLYLRVEQLAPYGLMRSLEEIVCVLKWEGFELLALPAVVLLEHFHANYTFNANHWLRARMLRIELLVNIHFFSEAAAMIAALPSTMKAIIEHTLPSVIFSNAIQAHIAVPVAGSRVKIEDFDSSLNGLVFFGLPAFFNHLPPTDDRNKAAIKWIQTFGDAIMKPFLSQFTVEYPIAKMSAVEKKKIEDDFIAEETKKMEEASKGKKKGKGEPDPLPPVITLPTAVKVPLFEASTLCKISLLCAQLLLELAGLDPKLGNPSYQYLNELTEVADKLVNTTVDDVLKEVGAAVSNINKQSAFVENYLRTQVLKSKLLMKQLKFRDCRLLVMKLLTFLKSESFSNVSYSVKCEITQAWYYCRDLLVDIANRQGRFADALTMVKHNLVDTETGKLLMWQKMSLFHRAYIYFKLGDFENAEKDCVSISDVSKQWKLIDIVYIKSLLMRAAILKLKSLTLTAQSGLELMVAALEVAREAKAEAHVLSAMFGLLPPDSNMTNPNPAFVPNTGDAISSYELFPVSLFNFTGFHRNDPLLTVNAGIDTKTYTELAKFNAEFVSADKNVHLNKCKPAMEGQKQRLAPIDASESVYVSNEYSNIYTREVRILAMSYALGAELIDDIRNTELVLPTDADDLLREEVQLSEDGLKVLRYVVYCPTHIRLKLLFYAAKTRFADVKKQIQEKGKGRNVDSSLFISPLTAALSIAMGSTHPWRLMVDICVQLVEIYGSQDVVWKEEDMSLRLKKAVQYLNLSIKLSNQFDIVTKTPYELVASDAAFQKLSADVELLASQSVYSSAIVVPPKLTAMEQAIAASVAVSAAGGKDAKGKAPPAAKGGGGGGGGGGDLGSRSGRDVLLLFATSLRESEAVPVENAERDLASDLHFLLKKNFPAYSAKCLQAALPNPADNIAVPMGSVSSLKSKVVAARDPSLGVVVPNTDKGDDEKKEDDPRASKFNLFECMTIYFLLGARQSEQAAAPVDPKAKGKAPDPKAAPASTGALSDPQLVKVAINRTHTYLLEKGIRDLRNKLLDATEKQFVATIIKEVATEFGLFIVAVAELLATGKVAYLDELGKALYSPSTIETIKGRSFFKESSVEAVLSDVQILEAPTDPSKLQLKIKFKSQEGTVSAPVSVSVSEATMLNLSNLLGTSLANDSVLDNEMCVFLRSVILGESQ